jgi:ketosteroid isomerase-like protein
MSQKNLETVRQAMAAEARHDDAAVFALYAEDIEWDVSQAGGPVTGIAGVLRGHEGVRTWFRTWYQGFEDVRFVVDELVDAGVDVLVVVRQSGRGRASGVDVLMDLFGVWTIEGGKVARAVWFMDRAKAFEAVGLRE